MAFGQIIWGTWSDIVGRKILLTSGVFLFSISSYLITIVSPDFILLLRLIQGASTGSMYSISQGIIADQSETREKMIFNVALSDLGFGLAWIILPFSGGIIASIGSWKENFYIMSGFIFIIGIFCVLLLTESRDTKLLKKESIKSSLRNFLKMYLNPCYIIIPIIIAIPNIFFTTFNSIFPSLVTNKLNLSPFIIGIVITILGISYTIVVFANTGFLEKYNSLKVMYSMTFLFIVTAVIQLLFSLIGFYNIYIISIPVILNVAIWGIMFPHILAHALMIYRKSGGLVGSHCGFTFWLLTGISVMLYGKIFKNNFTDMCLFTVILSMITIFLVFSLDKICKKRAINENI
ncbi:MAG TPA: MFS transporter [Victivallales bacterium]|nr:MFS transporter [Victivallales bacterium]